MVFLYYMTMVLLKTDSRQMNEILNTHLCSVFTQEDQTHIQDKFCFYFPTMPDFVVTTTVVVMFLHDIELSKAAGPDEIL